MKRRHGVQALVFRRVRRALVQQSGTEPCRIGEARFIERRGRVQEPEAGKAERALGRAGDAYRRVLEKNESNIYAANGMGAVLAENGHLTTAREIFTAVLLALS